MKFVIVDYGMGNIKSISTSLKYLGVEDVTLSSDFETLKSADKLILPGVGSFGKAMSQIREKNLDIYLKELVTDNNKPILGICLGMQLMGKSSNENGEHTGLNLIDATVKKFEVSNLKVPHVGFNQVQIAFNSKLYADFTGEPDFYFTHSYRMMSDADINASFCDYGGKFVASFEKDNVAGVQFHPELSQNNGLKLLKNFIDKY